MEMSVWEYSGDGTGKPEVNRSPVHVEVEWAGKPGTEQQKGALTLRGTRALRVALWIRHCRYHPPPFSEFFRSIPSTSRYAPPIYQETLTKSVIRPRHWTKDLATEGRPKQNPTRPPFRIFSFIVKYSMSSSRLPDNSHFRNMLSIHISGFWL
ncbi:hypothetical protein NPIL_140691 [Nephila pilipes]|uniref:Uncharacterized protein n=1 Tax=Nephila pilipes TaxID=299642 RepID=A0A8X6N023_NEPPI|nr:hypothetical protein NPIL_140691 [Nephila pilipes]